MVTIKEETKGITGEELQLNIKNDLIVTLLDEEGVVFEPSTRRSFLVNETAVFFLKVLQANHEGVILSSIKELLKEQYSVDDDKIIQDLDLFIDQLQQYDLVSFQLLAGKKNASEIRNPDNEVIAPYSKPVIEEEIRVLSVTGAAVRAAHMAAARSAAVSRATAAGFQGFR